MHPDFSCAYTLEMKSTKPQNHPFFIATLCVLLLPIFAAASVEAAGRIVGGKWESAMTTDGDTRTVTYCISAEEAASINGDSKSGRAFAEKKSGGRCTINSYEIKGDTVSYSLTCGNRTIVDTTAFHGETSEGTKTTSSEGKAVTSRLKSRRIGAC